MNNKTINNYTLLYKLGDGGMAEVWYAENNIGKKAAVKILKKELSLMTDVVARFENEARVMVQLNHPNIRQVYDYATINSRPCIIMEYLEGADLSQRLKKGEHFSKAQITKWWNQMVEALNYTHAKNVVHRDIKPSNIFICQDGQLKLLDFGIAKIKDSITITQTGTRMGTLMYMSPEQIKDSKHLDYRTDIYSLAVTFFHLLTGTAPYDNTKSSEFEIQTRIVTEELNLSLLPTEWSILLGNYLKKDVDKRTKLDCFYIKSQLSAQSNSPTLDESNIINAKNNTEKDKTALIIGREYDSKKGKKPTEITYQCKLIKVKVIEATFWQRTLAIIIDILIIHILFILIYFSILPETSREEIVVYVLLILLYISFNIFKKGNSLGKKILKIRCVDEGTLELPKFDQSFVRIIFSLLSLLILGLGFFKIWSKKKQTLHDVIAKTLIIQKIEF